MSTKQEVYDAFTNERDYQDKRWGTIKDHPHSLIEWIVIAEDCLAKAKAGWFKGDLNAMKVGIIKAGATATAALEQHGSDHSTI